MTILIVEHGIRTTEYDRPHHSTRDTFVYSTLRSIVIPKSEALFNTTAYNCCGTWQTFHGILVCLRQVRVNAALF